MFCLSWFLSWEDVKLNPFALEHSGAFGSPGMNLNFVLSCPFGDRHEIVLFVGFDRLRMAYIKLLAVLSVTERTLPG